MTKAIKRNLWGSLKSKTMWFPHANKCRYYESESAA